MIIERDVALRLRDGTAIYVDVFRPEGGNTVPRGYAAINPDP